MKKTYVGYLTTVVALSCVVTAFAKPQPREFLYVVNAPQATVTADTLTLNHPQVTFFTDRPVRDAGAMSIAAFLKLWDKGANSFAKDNPNAAFVAKTPSSNIAKKTFVELSHPHYNAQRQQLTFRIKSVDKNYPIVKGQFTESALFVDCYAGGFGINCG